jgi:hypothetical protein
MIYGEYPALGSQLSAMKDLFHCQVFPKQSQRIVGSPIGGKVERKKTCLPIEVQVFVRKSVFTEKPRPADLQTTPQNFFAYGPEMGFRLVHHRICKVDAANAKITLKRFKFIDYSPWGSKTQTMSLEHRIEAVAAVVRTAAFGFHPHKSDISVPILIISGLK